MRSGAFSAQVPGHKVRPVPESVPHEPESPPTPATGPAATEAAFPPEFRVKLPLRDRVALERFYEFFFDRVYGYVRRMLSEDQLAEDVTQDVFMHIQRSIHTYDPARDPGPWVFTIATNKVRDFWRSRRHKDAQLESSLDDEERRFHAPAKDPGPLPELEREELSRELSRAIDQLPPGMRETLVLRYYEGLSFEEIGTKIGRNETAVRKRYSRALGDLREALAKYIGPGRPPAREVG
jgi:RNA polymerase sigma-70 factor, ECF subfamily